MGTYSYANTSPVYFSLTHILLLFLELSIMYTVTLEGMGSVILWQHKKLSNIAHIICGRPLSAALICFDKCETY